MKLPPTLPTVLFRIYPVFAHQYVPSISPLSVFNFAGPLRLNSTRLTTITGRFRPLYSRAYPGTASSHRSYLITEPRYPSRIHATSSFTLHSFNDLRDKNKKKTYPWYSFKSLFSRVNLLHAFNTANHGSNDTTVFLIH